MPNFNFLSQAFISIYYLNLFEQLGPIPSATLKAPIKVESGACGGNENNRDE
jgi:hypothetical protein